MADDSGFDKFKDDVYRDVRWLEFFEKDFEFKRGGRTGGAGCVGAVISGVFGGIFKAGRNRMKQHRKVAELRKTAAEILAKPAVKKAVCEVLDDSIRLAIDVANAITPVLYRMKGKTADIPKDPMLYAIISKHIADRGVANYCG